MNEKVNLQKYPTKSCYINQIKGVDRYGPHEGKPKHRLVFPKILHYIIIYMIEQM